MKLLAVSDLQLDRGRAGAVWPSAEALHGQGKAIAGVGFFGLGGAVPPTPCSVEL